MKPFVRSGDFWSGIALAALGAYIVSEARRWTYVSDEGPGAGFFPLWYGGLMVVFSLVLVAQAVTRRAAPSQPVNWVEVRRALSAWVAFVLCVALMPWLGFIISFGLLTWFIVAVMARRPQRVAIPLAIGFAVFFWALFDWALDLSLPKSPWF